VAAMLIEKYDPEIKKYTCFSSFYNCWFLTGIGNTPKEAQTDMFLKLAGIAKDRAGFTGINTDCT
jgi:hypothetical protein